MRAADQRFHSTLSGHRAAMIAAVRASVAGILLCGVYLLLVSTVDLAEVVVAVLLAAVGAAAGGLVHTGGELVRARHLPLMALRTVPAEVVSGAVSVLVAAVRGRRGRLRESPVRVPGRDDGAVTRRAFGALALSAGPASVWVEADPGNGTVLVHVLGAEQPGATERALQ